MTITCSKTYTDIPIAHRQHRHDGHCAFIHGHNWSFTLTFGCTELDANGFVIDFGKLRYIRDWIDANLDHACLFNNDDPLADILIAAGNGKAWKAYRIDCCSCEGLARHLFDVFDRMVRENTGGRAFLVAIEVAEDSRNSARWARS